MGTKTNRLTYVLTLPAMILPTSAIFTSSYCKVRDLNIRHEKIEKKDNISWKNWWEKNSLGSLYNSVSDSADQDSLCDLSVLSLKQKRGSLTSPLYPWSVSLRSMTVIGLKLRSHSRTQPSRPPVAKPSSQTFILKIPDWKKWQSVSEEVNDKWANTSCIQCYISRHSLKRHSIIKKTVPQDNRGRMDVCHYSASLLLKSSADDFICHAVYTMSYLNPQWDIWWDKKQEWTGTVLIIPSPILPSPHPAVDPIDII